MAAVVALGRVVPSDLSHPWDSCKSDKFLAVMCKILLKSILKIQNKIVFSKYFSK